MSKKNYNTSKIIDRQLTVALTPLLVCLIFPTYSPVRNKTVITENLTTGLDLRWLKTVSSTFQDLDFNVAL